MDSSAGKQQGYLKDRADHAIRLESRRVNWLDIHLRFG